MEPVQGEMEPVQDETEPLQDETEPLQDETEPLRDEMAPTRDEKVAPIAGTGLPPRKVVTILAVRRIDLTCAPRRTYLRCQQDRLRLCNADPVERGTRRRSQTGAFRGGRVSPPEKTPTISFSIDLFSIDLFSIGFVFNFPESAWLSGDVRARAVSGLLTL
jgi:hypothetical protein